MADLVATDIADLVNGTLRELGRMKFSQIAQTLTVYEAFSHWFKRDRVSFDEGVGIQRNLMSKISNNAKHVGLMETDVVNISDVMDQLQVNWVHAQTSWAFIYQETLMNRGSALIYNVIQPRRADALISLVEELENKAWAAPSSSSVKTEPYGLPYWIVKDNTTGFTGAAASGHGTTVAGVALADSPNFKNYSAKYTSLSKSDAIKKLRTAHRKTGFKSPITIQDYRGSGGQRYRLYVNETTMSGIEDLGEAQNENLGRDIASMDGTITFRNHPIVWIPKLDSDTDDPIYGVDHSTFYPVCLAGDYLRESEAKPAPSQHNCFQVFVDLSYNYLCVDRRRNWVLHNGI